MTLPNPDPSLGHKLAVHHIPVPVVRYKSSRLEPMRISVMVRVRNMVRIRIMVRVQDRRVRASSPLGSKAACRKGLHATSHAVKGYTLHRMP